MKIRQVVRTRLETLLSNRHSVSFYPQTDIHLSMLGKPFKRRKFKAMRLLPRQKKPKTFLTKGTMDSLKGTERAERAAMKAANFVKNYARPIKSTDLRTASLSPEARQRMADNQWATYHRLVADGRHLAG